MMIRRSWCHCITGHMCSSWWSIGHNGSPSSAWAALLRWSGDDRVLVSLDSRYGHDGGHDDSTSSSPFQQDGHDEEVMILQDKVMILTIQYMSSMIRMRERMKVRRRQQWPSRLNPWLFLQNIFQKIDFCCRNIFIRRLSVFYFSA